MQPSMQGSSLQGPVWVRSGDWDGGGGEERGARVRAARSARQLTPRRATVSCFRAVHLLSRLTLR